MRELKKPLKREAAVAVVALSMVLVALSGGASVRVDEFGKTAKGETVRRYTVVNARGTEAVFIDYGARIVRLAVPDRDGKRANVTLGYETLVDYEKGDPSFGSMIGRVVNRISDAVFTLDGKTHELDRNFTRDGLTMCIHGGRDGWQNRVWRSRPLEESGRTGVEMSLTDAAGRGGFPGTVEFVVRYWLTDDDVWRIETEARTDAPTPLNPAQHAYFNLSGDFARPVTNHLLKVNASLSTPTGKGDLPTGEIRSHAKKPYDYRLKREIGPVPLNINYVPDMPRGVLRRVAEFEDPASGRTLEVATTLPGLQVYSGRHIGFAACAFEAQQFPNAINRPEFPDCVLRPGEVRRDVTEYRFGVIPRLMAYSMLTHDGRRLVSRLDGTNTVFELVPTNNLPANLPPVREWKIYCIKSTHTDIGLHNPQYEQRAGSVAKVDRAAELVDADQRPDSDVSAYRYVMEGYWFWHNYPMDRGEAAARRIVNDYVKRGRMDIGVTCAGNHTHLFSDEEVARSAYTAKALRERWGMDGHTMIMADNPGISWSVVQPYVEAGIQNVVFLPNQWNPLPSTIWLRDPKIVPGTWNPDAGGGGNRVDVRWDSDFPMLFRWQAADGTSEMLFWSGTQYGSGGKPFGFRSPSESIKDMEKAMPRQMAKMDAKYPYDVWLIAAYGDDEMPNDVVSRLFAKWNAKWKWPQFRTVGTLDEPFDLVRAKWMDKVPVVRGEITSGWLQHAASTPELLARKFAADRALTAAEAEAALASATKGTPYPAEDFRRAWWALILNDEHSYGTSGYEGRRVFETWLQHRDWIEYAERIASRHAPKEEGRGKKEEKSGTQENKWYKLVVNDRGEITSIYDKELKRELVKGAVNRFLYTRDNHKTWEEDAAKALGAELVQKVWLDPDCKLIHIENTFRHARDLFNFNRYFRYGYQAFEFAVPNGRYVAQLNGPVIDPYRDLAGLTSDAHAAVRDWCAVENGEFGVALLQQDSTLTEFGEIHPDKTCCSFGRYEGPSSVYSYLFTDWLQMHNPDGDSFNPRFRYAITSYAGAWQDAHLPTLARETFNPRLAAIERRVRTSAPSVRLVSFKAAEDGDGYIARFRETEGRTVRATVVQDVLPGAKVVPVSTVEEPLSDAADGLAFLPYAMHAVRISDGRRVAVAPPTDDGSRYTELVTEPRVTHGEDAGQMYLVWGIVDDAGFDYDELERAEGDSDTFAFVAKVRRETHNGVPFVCMRYEDLGLKDHTRYRYRIRHVFRDGRKGPWSKPFGGLTRESSISVSTDRRMLEFR